MNNIKQYKKLIKNIVYDLSIQFKDEMNYSFLYYYFFLKKNIFKLFFFEKEIKFLTLYFFIFLDLINEKTNKNINNCIKYFLIFYLISFSSQKKKQKTDFEKKIFIFFERKYFKKINIFLKENNFKIKNIIPEFKSKTYVNWKKFSNKKIILYANFFELLICNIKNKNIFKKEINYNLGYSLAIATFVNFERKKYNFKFIKRFNPTNKIKTDLFFTKLYFWTYIVKYLKIYSPYKYNHFILKFNDLLN